MARMKKVTKESAAQAVQDIDWAAIDAMTDADIARQVAENPHAAPIMSREQILAARVRRARRITGLSQDAFAKTFHIPVTSLRDWEQGRHEPGLVALAYLRIIEREADTVRRVLAETDAIAA